MQHPALSPQLAPVESLCLHRRWQPPLQIGHPQSLHLSSGSGDIILPSLATYTFRRHLPVPDTQPISSPCCPKLGVKMEDSSHRRGIRPLPAIPTPPLPPSTLSPVRSLRPLPSPPITPSTSLRSRSFDGETAPTIHPKPKDAPGPQQSISLPVLIRLATNLNSPEHDTITLSSSVSSQPPASHITKRRRSAKLLGESALDKVVYSPQRSSSITGTKAMEVVGGLGERLTYLRAAIKVGRILDSASDEDSIEEEAEKSQDFGDYSWHLENGTVFRDTSDQRDSRKWIREKGGKRWEEHDYQAIISALRAL